MSALIIAACLLAVTPVPGLTAEPRTGAVELRASAVERRVRAPTPRPGAPQPRAGAPNPRAGPPAPRTSRREPQASAPEVKIVTPRPDRPLPDPIVIQALVRSSPGAAILRVVAFVDDRELGSLTEPPYRWVVPRPPDAPAVHVRIVAVDGAGREGMAELLATRSPRSRFAAEVPAVTLNLAVVDERDRFVADLRAEEIVIRDNGAPQQVLDFARAEAPLRVAILLDRSGSMQEKMDATRQALAGFLEQLGPQDQVKLMGFNHRMTSYTPFTSEHRLVAAFAQGITAEGSTALYDALLYGYRQLSAFDDARERRVVFLLTDGEDRDSRFPLQRALETVRASGVTVFALGQGEALDDGELRDVLVEIAESTGGEAFFEDEPRRLGPLLEQIAAAMRALYFVAYRPTDPTPGWHDIEVELRRPGLEARHKPGYERRPGSGGR